jgi:hypothetical protein
LLIRSYSFIRFFFTRGHQRPVRDGLTISGGGWADDDAAESGLDDVSLAHSQRSASREERGRS